MPDVTGIIESALYVDSMRRSVEFYSRVFGFRCEHVSERVTALRVAPGQVMLIMERGASSTPGVMPFGTVPPSDARGQQHLAFGVAPHRFGSWLRQLELHGVGIESTIDWPEGGRSVYFRDPDDHSIELKTSDWGGQLFDAPAEPESG